MFAARCDEMTQEWDPASVAFVESIPQRPDPGPTGEIGEKCRLAVAGLRDDQHDAIVNLRVQPIQKTIAGECFVAQGRRLDFC